MDIAEWIAERYDLTHRIGNWAARGVLPALEGVTAEMADWRAAPDQHTIAEIVAHMAYHTELVASRLRGNPRQYRPEDDWQVGESREDKLAKARIRLEQAHRDLAAVLADLPPAHLLDPVSKSWLSPKLVTRTIDLAVDIATHDLYHAGQIFVLKRLFANSASESRPGG